MSDPKLLDDPLLQSVPTVDGEKVLDRRYAIKSTLGHGGMGVVYRGVHLEFGEDVALKCLEPGLIRRDPVFVERFKREARLARKIRHPNVVGVQDVAQDADSGVHFIAMEFVEGTNAHQLVVNRGPLPVDEALGIALGAARGLAAAHDAGLVHRDVKPDNLLVSNAGVVKLADLGLAKQQDDAGMTCSGAGMGTPRYMAPEQFADAKNVNSTADVYALGATLYFLLTGHHGVQGTTLLEVMRKATEHEFPAVREVRPDVPEGVAAFIARCVSHDPTVRPSDGGAMVPDLTAMQSTAPSHTPAGDFDDMLTLVPLGSTGGSGLSNDSSPTLSPTPATTGLDDDSNAAIFGMGMATPESAKPAADPTHVPTVPHAAPAKVAAAAAVPPAQPPADPTATESPTEPVSPGASASGGKGKLIVAAVVVVAAIAVGASMFGGDEDPTDDSTTPVASTSDEAAEAPLEATATQAAATLDPEPDPEPTAATEATDATDDGDARPTAAVPAVVTGGPQPAWVGEPAGPVSTDDGLVLQGAGAAGPTPNLQRQITQAAASGRGQVAEVAGIVSNWAVSSYFSSHRADHSAEVGTSNAKHLQIARAATVNALPATKRKEAWRKSDGAELHALVALPFAALRDSLRNQLDSVIVEQHDADTLVASLDDARSGLEEWLDDLDGMSAAGLGLSIDRRRKLEAATPAPVVATTPAPVVATTAPAEEAASTGTEASSAVENPASEQLTSAAIETPPIQPADLPVEEIPVAAQSAPLTVAPEPVVVEPEPVVPEPEVTQPTAATEPAIDSPADTPATEAPSGATPGVIAKSTSPDAHAWTAGSPAPDIEGFAFVAENGQGYPEYDLDLRGGVTLRFVLAPAGTFAMGSTNLETGHAIDESPVHDVTLDAFLISRTEVTRAQWLAVLGEDPSSVQGADDTPVVSVSWEDVQFFNRFTRLSLPSEAQWEYAARGGQASSEVDVGASAWSSANSGGAAHAVATKAPNGFGVHDMLGNVWEWCDDTWHKRYYDAPTDGTAWMADSIIRGEDSARRVTRGGAYNASGSALRAAYRNNQSYTSKQDSLGFRSVKTLR